MAGRSIFKIQVNHPQKFFNATVDKKVNLPVVLMFHCSNGCCIVSLFSDKNSKSAAGKPKKIKYGVTSFPLQIAFILQQTSNLKRLPENLS